MNKKHNFLEKYYKTTFLIIHIRVVAQSFWRSQILLELCIKYKTFLRFYNYYKTENRTIFFVYLRIRCVWWLRPDGPGFWWLLWFPDEFFGRRLRVWIPSFFILNGLATYNDYQQNNTKFFHNIYKAHS